MIEEAGHESECRFLKIRSFSIESMETTDLHISHMLEHPPVRRSDFILTLILSSGSCMQTLNMGHPPRSSSITDLLLVPSSSFYHLHQEPHPQYARSHRPLHTACGDIEYHMRLPPSTAINLLTPITHPPQPLLKSHQTTAYRNISPPSLAHSPSDLASDSAPLPEDAAEANLVTDDFLCPLHTRQRWYLGLQVTARQSSGRKVMFIITRLQDKSGRGRWLDR